MELFKVFGRIGINGVEKAKSDLKNVDKQAKDSSNSMMSSFKKLGTVIGTVFAVDKIARFGAKLVSTAGDVQAETAQFEASFGDMAGTAEDTFNRVANATGVFATRLRVTGTKAFSQLKGAGMDANEALERTEVFLNLASDAAAYYDISLEDAEARIRSFMRGNVEAGDAIGLFTSESQRNTFALEMYGRKWLELTEAEKQNLMLNVAENIYAQSGALGQASRESDGLANVTGNLKEVWRQLLATVGKPVLEAVLPIMQSLTEKLIGLKKWAEEHEEGLRRVGQVISSVATLLWNFIEIIIKAVVWLGEHKTVLTAVCTVLGVMAGLYIKDIALKGLSAVKTAALTVATHAQTAAQWLLNAALHASPITWVITAIGLLVGAFALLWNKVEGFRNFWINIWNGIVSVVKGAVDWIKNLLSSIKLPHFKFDGKFSLAPLSVPKLKVEWYKDGGVMTKPTLFGINPATGNPMGGGEAGAEAIAPISTLQSYVSAAVHAETNGLNYTMNKLLELLGQYLPDIRDNMNNQTIVLDSGHLVNGIANKMDAKLGAMSNTKARYGV